MNSFRLFRLCACILVACVVLSASVSAQAATITVTTTTDELANPGPGTGCSLREAIQSINGAANYGGCTNTGAAYGTSDTINIPAGTYNITIAGTNENSNANGDYDIKNNVIIAGAGSSATTINGDGAERVFHITGAYTVSISGVTVTGGAASLPGYYGGGIYYQGSTITVTNSVISGNTAKSEGGGMGGWGTLNVTNSTISGNTSSGEGGGIDHDSGTATITGSTITGNTSAGITSGGEGGGIDVDGTLFVTNSTISDNTVANGGGGGIEISSATATITNSTIVRNTAPAGKGGGFYMNGGSVNFINSIVADNGAGLDCKGAIGDGGGNIDSDGSCGTFAHNAAMVQGTGFGALANNGGPTQTRALLAGSAAINAAPTCAALTTDQRGVARPQGSACDIGAYEYATAIPTLSEWAQIGMAALLVGGGLLAMRRRAED